jgi:3-dehydroquinate synthetase
MLAAATLAVARGELSAEAAQRLARLIEGVGERPRIDDLSTAACVAATARDKKVVAGTLHFVMPVGIGRTRIASDVTKRELATALRTLGMRP